MYLFGSIHAGRADMYPLPQFIMDAFYRSDYLAVEIDMMALLDDPAAQLAQSMAMLYMDGRNITDDLGEDLVARLHEVLRPHFLRQGLPPQMMDMFKPFAWNTMLLDAVMEEAGLSAEYGIDMYFMNAAQARGMEILEVESMELQMDMMLGFSTELWVFLLESSLDIDAGAEGVIYMLDWWLTGDYGTFAAYRYAQYEGMPAHLWHEYMDGMLNIRDIDMAAVARQYMAEGRKVFFLVGLLHMVGDGSINYHLRNAGYEIERILP
jgi:uncharacterized protein YbaP (TraB family)